MGALRMLAQTLFASPDNSRERAWSHALATKPHAVSPLENTPRPGASVPVKAPRAGMYCAEGPPRENPYYDEIHAFAAPAHALQKPEGYEPPPPIDGMKPTAGPTPFTWVATLAQLEELRLHLLEERVQEIALDVEHHNYRSYQGLVCLVQLSTRFGDYIIDALSPPVRANFHILNDALADPAKIKVLHGAEHDVLWLQRDLNAYLVGLFDTYHAASILSYPAKSLAYLLSRHTNFEADKRWQLADWRIRPLPAPMLYYARADTHSLLYVYDALRAELATLGGASAEPLLHVFERSKKTAARTYAKEAWDPAGEGREGWRTMWKRAGGEEARGVDDRWEKEGIEGLSRTERLWRRLHDWRDRCARENDESTR
jgi:exosome complex exonuclease RRP6